MSNKTVKILLTLNQIKTIQQAFVDMDGNIKDYDSRALSYEEYPKWMQDAQLRLETKLYKAEQKLKGE